LADLVPAEDLESAFVEIEAIESEQLDGITVLPGAVRALQAVPPDRCAVVTSGTPPLARARIAAVGLPVPPLLVTPDDVPRGKPDPAPYLYAAQRLAVSPADCLVVEDAVAGLTAARSAGCASLALTTTYPADDLSADAVVGSLDDVRFALEGDSVRLRPA
jgi:sugar-phosphatase